MSEPELQHFLVIYKIADGHADVIPFRHDYRAALLAYSKAEEEHRRDDDVEVVLFGSDSIETLERTHSSYFQLSEKHIDQVVARDLAELGLA